MSTFTIRVTSSATNSAGTAYGQQPDLNAPSFLDMEVTNSTDPRIQNGRYDAYCLNPIIDIGLAPAYSYGSEAASGGAAASFVPIGFSSISQTQVDRINWILAQNYTSDGKYSGQFNFGEVQLAIWKILGFTDAQISGAGLALFLNDNNRNVVSGSDVNFLVSASQAAVASGLGVLPTDAFFTAVIDPAGNVQPLIIQLQSAKLGNYVWLDSNADGVQGVGEAGVDRVIVELYDGNGVLIASTLTGDDFSTAAVEHGFYQFAGLKAGDYQVKFVAPTYAFTAQDANANTTDAVDSDANQLTGLSHIVTLTAGQSNQTIDAGLVLPAPVPARLSGYVYEDAGNDGVRNSEVPIAGVLITLTGTDTLGNVVNASTTTNTSGFYEFANLAAGTYTVTEAQPANFLDGKDTAGSTGGSTAANDIISGITLAAGANSVENNFGELLKAAINGFVYCDDNNDGIKQGTESGLGGVTVTLTGTNDLGQSVSLTTTTAANGSYSFADLRPGTYEVTETTQPAGKLDGKDTAGDTPGSTSTNEVISNIVLTPGLVSNNNNFGEILPARISGYVYEDVGNDGVRNAEPAIAGVTVTLTGTNDLGAAVTASTTTNALGYYEFTGLRPGSYQVVETQPAAYLDGKDTAGSTGGVVSNDQIATIPLLAGQHSAENNFGELPKGAINGFVYCDDNNDGIKQDTESGLGGVTVTLTGTNDLGQPVTLTTTTAADGSYSFADLRPGTYTVTETTQPVGKLDGKDTAGNTPGSTSANEVISNIVLTPGLVSNNNNFGEILPAKLSGFVYEDAGNDGVKGAGEVGIAGVTVTLTGTDDLGNAVSKTTTTDATGQYSFDTLRPGTYAVTESQPATYLDGKDSAGSTGGVVTNDQISTVTLIAGADSVNNNFGELPPAKLSGFVYEDAGNDGVKGAGEVGIAGVTVTLTGTDDRGNAVSKTTTTDATGQYSFDTLRPGTYAVTESQPANYLDGKDTAGSTGGVVSNDKISTVTLNAGDNSVNNNFGEIVSASLGDRLWTDSNGNGKQDSGEVGITDQTVTLIGGGADGLINGIGDTTATATTAADGVYNFAGLTPGVEYQVQFSAPAGTVFTGQNVSANGVDTIDSDADTVTGKTQIVTLVQGENNTTLDAGVYAPANLTGFVYQDAGNDGVRNAEPGIAGVELTLSGTNGLGQPVTATATTDVNGFYQFTNLAPGSYTVSEAQPAGFIDGKDTAGSAGGSNAVNDVLSAIVLGSGINSSENNFGEIVSASLGDRLWTDSDGNGKQDSGEVGITDQTVTLIGGGADGLIATTGDNTTATTTTGADGVYNFAGLTPGVEYQVQFSAPAGTVFTGQNVSANGFDTVDSDADTVTGKTQIVTLAQGETNTTLDAGVYAPAKLSGYVYKDAGNDGVRNAEPGIAGVVLTLTGTNGLGEPVTATATTDANGFYQFTNLAPGSYTVSEAQPAGFIDGKDTAGSTGGSNAVNDVLSAIVLGSGANSTENNFGEIVSASLGDRLWTDSDGNGKQDGLEAGISGQTVTLIGGGADGLIATTGDNTTATTTTGVDGVYNFAGLTPGVEYQVQFSAPAGTVFTGQNVSANGFDTVDSDADTVTGKTQIVTLAQGENNLTLDAGVYAGAAIGDRVWVDVDKNGVQDANEAGVAGVRVYLRDAAGNQVGGPIVTNAAGEYLFTQLRPGDYSVQFDLATLPSGYTVTTRDAAAANDATDSDGDATTGRTVRTSLESGETDLSWDLGIQARIGIDLEKLVRGEYLVQETGGGEGLTPGFWKNHSSYGPAPLSGWPETGLSPDARYEAIFGVDVPGSAPTLLEALGTGGGEVNALLRHSAAALLNAANPYVSYAYTQAQIITMVQQAFANGSYESTKNLFATQNELGADLSTPASGGSTTVVTPDYDADTPGTGPIIPVGGQAVFTYLVKNTGDTELSNVTLVDDRIRSLTFVGGDTDGDNRLDVNETWRYTASETVLSNTQYVNTGTVTALDTTSGATVTDVDLAHYNTPALGQTLGDRVWLDRNANGIQDTGEQGIASVTVQLKDTAGAVLQTATTDANGNYLFDVAAGSYLVSVIAPTGYLVTGRDLGGNDNLDSDIDATTKTTGTVTVAAGQQNLTVDAGLYQTASIGNRVWLDINANGVQDTNEAGVAGVRVYLRDGAGNQVGGSVITDAAGQYLFTNLRPGDYSVQFDLTTLPSGYTVTTRDAAAANDATDSDGDATTGRTVLTSLESGETDLSWDLGIQARIGIDLEKLVRGEYLVQETGGGEGLTPGFWKNHSSYGPAPLSGWPETGLSPDARYESIFGVDVPRSAPTLLEALGDGGGDVNALLRHSTAALLNAANPQVDYAYTQAQIITMVQQAFANGSYESTKNLFATQNELGADLSTPTSNGSTTVVTPDYDADTPGTGPIIPIGGQAVFTYLVKNTGDTELSNVTLVDDRIRSLTFVGGDTDGDNRLDVNETWRYTASETVLSNTQYVNTGTVTALDTTSGATVTDVDLAHYNTPALGQTLGDRVWLDRNANGVQDSGEQGIASVTVQLKNTAGTVLQTTTTDATGNYLFDVAAGSYLVSVIAPTGYLVTGRDLGGNDNLDSDIDATTKTTGTVTVAAGQQNLTVDAGFYQTASIGNRVWLDTNANGVQDSGEAGIAGVSVKLLDGVGNLLRTTTTNASGEYAFGNLNLGDYKVQVVAPSGHFATKKDQGSNDTVDSDIDSTGTTVVTTLTAGENDLTWAAGLYRKASVGDKVWEDKNYNGLQDVGESGIGSIKVQLFDAAGTTVLATTTTNSSGNYLFANLDPGSFLLQFDKTKVSYAGANMSNWKWGVKDLGSNDAVDSDVTGDGQSTTNVTRTSLFSLVSGQNDMTRDAAITPIVIDLDGNGIQTISRADSSGSFDLFGNGQAVTSGWISGNDGFLAVDRNGNGQIDSIGELFGGNAKGAGFSQLAAFDSNGDGAVNAADKAFADLRIWQDVNGNHATDAGELMTLAQAGIASLSVAYTELPFLDAQGNLHLERSSATLASGGDVAMTDVYFSVSADDGAAAGVALPTLADLLGNDSSLDQVLGCNGAAPCGLAGADQAPGGSDAAEVLRRLAALMQNEGHSAIAA